MKKKLCRSVNDKKIAGVCAGVAKYLDMDPTVIRVLWALITFFGGAGIAAYIVCWIIMPEETIDYSNYVEYTNVDVDDERGVR